MDPLSLAASAITVTTAASAVSVALYEFSSTIRNVDSRISKLSDELSSLVGFLEAIGQTLQQCREQPLSLESIGEDLWQQSALALDDCKTTLGDLGSLIEKIKASASHGNVFRRARVAVKWTVYGRDIAGFRNKIHQSNWALQTMLSAINVSLSLRGNDTQDTALYELRQLKHAIKQCLNITPRHADVLPHSRGNSDVRAAHNLRNLAHAAQNFHSSASSSAGTLRHTSTSPSTNGRSDMSRSVAGTLTSAKITQIREYLTNAGGFTGNGSPRHIPGFPADSGSGSMLRVNSEPFINEKADDSDDDHDDDEEFESSLFRNGLEEVAKESMFKKDFAKAEIFLKRAMQRHTGPLAYGFKQLQIQLAVCYIFQRKFHLAETLVVDIAKKKSNMCIIVCNLLHTLALAYLSEYHFGRAITLCKRALHGKRKLMRDLPEVSLSDYYETLGLLAKIYDIQGDMMDGEIIRRAIPSDYTYTHPPGDLEFIVEHPTLLSRVFGADMPSGWGRSISSRTSRQVTLELPSINVTTPINGANHPHPKNVSEPRSPHPGLREKLDLCEKIELDTAKEVAVSTPSATSDNYEAGDEASSPTEPSSRSSPPTPRTQKRLFGWMFGDFSHILRSRHTASPEDTAAPRFTEPEQPPSPLRQRLAAGFWSHNPAIDTDKPKGKLRKKASNESITRSFTFLRRRQHEPGFRVLNTKFNHGTSEGTGGSKAHTQTTPNDRSHHSEVAGSAELPTNLLAPRRYCEYSQSSPAMDNNFGFEGRTSDSRHMVNENARPTTGTPTPRVNLVIHIPNSNKIPGQRKPLLLAHYPQWVSPSPIYAPKAISEVQPAQAANPVKGQSSRKYSGASSEAFSELKTLPASKAAPGGKGTYYEPGPEGSRGLRRHKSSLPCYGGGNGMSTPHFQPKRALKESKSFSFEYSASTNGIGWFEDEYGLVAPRKMQNLRDRPRSSSNVIPPDELGTMAPPPGQTGEDSQSDAPECQYAKNRLDPSSKPPRIPPMVPPAEDIAGETFLSDSTVEYFRKCLDTSPQSIRSCENGSQIPRSASPAESNLGSISGFSGNPEKLSQRGSRSDSGYETMHEI